MLRPQLCGVAKGPASPPSASNLPCAHKSTFLLTAALKHVLPDNVGLFVRNGVPIGFGVEFPIAAGVEVGGGSGVIPSPRRLALPSWRLTAAPDGS